MNHLQTFMNILETCRNPENCKACKYAEEKKCRQHQNFMAEYAREFLHEYAPRILEPEEVKERQVLYIEVKRMPHDIEPLWLLTGNDEKIYVMKANGNYMTYPLREYGETWRAWSVQPVKEIWKSAEWENDRDPDHDDLMKKAEQRQAQTLEEKAKSEPGRGQAAHESGKSYMSE